MGSLFGGSSGSRSGDSSQPNSTTVTPLSPAPVALGPYPDDGAKRMPTANSPSAIAAARKKRTQITQRSGRESTRLVNDAGTRSYQNSFLGSVS